MRRVLEWMLDGLAVLSLATVLLAVGAYVWSIHHSYAWSADRAGRAGCCVGRSSSGDHALLKLLSWFGGAMWNTLVG